MTKRPLSITIVSSVFIALGAIGFVAGLRPLVIETASRGIAGIDQHTLLDSVIVSASGLVAAIGGVYTLRGFQRGRWLLGVWMGFHLIVSMLHSTSELLVHCVLFAVISYFLFRPSSSAYFRGPRAERT